MIKNERQYKITRSQLTELEQVAIARSENPDPAVHPRLQLAEVESIHSLISELREQIAEYEALTSGSQSVITIDSFEDFPRALIQARIASGLSQRELAERLGLKEQQIQRYEATDYASASLERIQVIIDALGIKIRKEITLPNAPISLDTLFRRLKQVGLDSTFVISRLIPRNLRAQLEDSDDAAEKETLTIRVAMGISRVFGWSSDVLFGRTPLQPNLAVVATTRFKTAANTNEIRTNAYTLYAHFLALLVLEATPALHSKPIPTDPGVVRQSIVDQYGSLTFDHALRYVWSLGIPILPLSDSGAFHGACWRVEGRNIIVLKQNVKSPARWLSDLFHELGHAAQHPDQATLNVIEESELSKDRQISDEEQRVTQYSSDIILDGRAEMLAQLCVDEAGGHVERLKQAVPRVAKREGVRTDALANYMAFRLSIQGINWWGAANNLQVNNPDPWATARDLLLEHLNLSTLNEVDRGILLQSLAENES